MIRERLRVRQWIPSIFVMICFATTSAMATEELPWFKRALVGIEVGPTGAQFGSDPADVGYAAKFDGRDIVRRSSEAQCEYVVIWARDGEYTYYNSNLQPKAPGLGKRDVL